MDAIMLRIGQKNKGSERVDRDPVDWRKAIAKHKEDREAYVMMVAENDPLKYKEFMRSSCSVFLTALESFARRIESQEEQKNKVAEPIKRK